MAVKENTRQGGAPLKKVNHYAILSLSLMTIMSGAVVAPVLGLIAEEFSEARDLYIRMVIALPALFIVVFSLVSGYLSRRVRKKHLAMAGVTLFFAGGVSGALTGSIGELLFTRAVLGSGLGLILPHSTGFIADFYEGPDRIRNMGYSTAMNNFGGIFATVAAGYLALYDWRYAFYFYGITFFILLLIVFHLPEKPFIKSKAAGKVTLAPRVLAMAAAMLVVTLIFYASPSNLALFVAREQLGTSDTSALLITILTISGFGFGMLFKTIKGRLRSHTGTFGFLAFIAGYLILIISSDLKLLSLAMVVIGYGTGTLNPLIFYTTSMVAGPAQTTLSLALVSGSMFLAQFITPFIIAGIAGLGGMIGIRLPFWFSIGLASVALMVYLVFRDRLYID